MAQLPSSLRSCLAGLTIRGPVPRKYDIHFTSFHVRDAGLEHFGGGKRVGTSEDPVTIQMKFVGIAEQLRLL
jgi:hypothetical protein